MKTEERVRELWGGTCGHPWEDDDIPDGGLPARDCRRCILESFHEERAAAQQEARAAALEERDREWASIVRRLMAYLESGLDFEPDPEREAAIRVTLNNARALLEGK